MKSRPSRIFICLLIGVGFTASAQQFGFMRTGADKHKTRAIAEARAHRQAEVRQEEAVAGRQLTAEERAELRDQLRREWASHTESSQTAESQPTERILPGPGGTPMRVRRQ